MCAPVVMDVILSVILVIITITTPTMATTFLKLALPHGRCLLHGLFDHEQGVHILMIPAACFRGVEGMMGNFALAPDDLQRLYPTQLVIGRKSYSCLAYFCFSHMISRFSHSLPPLIMVFAIS